MLSAQTSAAETVAGATRRLVARNTLYLTAAQVLTIPLSILSNALSARYLGPEAFGYAYLAFTLCGFVFLMVGWGHEAVLPALIAKDHRLAGTMFASSIAWRTVTSVVASLALMLWARLLHYPVDFQWALALTCIVTTLTYFVAACKDAIQGLERTDIPAYAHVGQQLLAIGIASIVLVAGGDLLAVLTSHAVAGVIVLAVLWRTLPSVGIGALSLRRDSMVALFKQGLPFVTMGLVIAVQPNIDAFFLSQRAPVEVMGWFAVSRRLVGALLLPATALVGALYPTLCRLHATDDEGFRRTTNDALRFVSLIVTPVALCCALYPDVAVRLLGGESFRPAEDNLRVMALFLPLVYFSMPLASCLTAAGKQRQWTIVQCACVATSLILDPLLIPIFQGSMGNGGVGVCVAAVISEVLMVAAGIALAPRGIFDRRLGRLFGLTLVSGAAMALVAYLARTMTPFVAAPLSLVAYVLTLWVTGAIEPAQIAWLRGELMRRIPGRAARASGV